MPKGIIERIGTISLSVFLALLIVGFLQLYEATQSSKWADGVEEVTWERCNEDEIYADGYCDELAQEKASAFHTIIASILPLMVFIGATVIAYKKKKDDTHDGEAQGNIQQIEL